MIQKLCWKAELKTRTRERKLLFSQFSIAWPSLLPSTVLVFVGILPDLFLGIYKLSFSLSLCLSIFICFLLSQKCVFYAYWFLISFLSPLIICTSQKVHQYFTLISSILFNGMMLTSRNYVLWLSFLPWHNLL